MPDVVVALRGIADAQAVLNGILAGDSADEQEKESGQGFDHVFIGELNGYCRAMTCLRCCGTD